MRLVDVQDDEGVLRVRRDVECLFECSSPYRRDRQVDRDDHACHIHTFGPDGERISVSDGGRLP
jgi:hypothetical protein